MIPECIMNFFYKSHDESWSSSYSMYVSNSPTSASSCGVKPHFVISLLLRYLIGKIRANSIDPRGHRGPCTCAADLVHDFCHVLSDIICYSNNFLLKTFCHKNNLIVLLIYYIYITPWGGGGGVPSGSSMLLNHSWVFLVNLLLYYV